MMNAASFDPDNLAESILDTVPMGVLYCDHDCIVRFMNETYARYLGIAKAQALGRPITDLIPDSRAHIVMQTGTAEMGEQCRVGQGKGKRTLIVNRIPVRNAAGEVVGMLSQSIFSTPEELKDFAARYPQKEFDSVLAEVNRAREAIMRRAIETNASLTQADLPKVRAVFAKLAEDTARPGDRLQGPDGTWTVKK